MEKYLKSYRVVDFDAPIQLFSLPTKKEALEYIRHYRDMLLERDHKKVVIEFIRKKRTLVPSGKWVKDPVYGMRELKKYKYYIDKVIPVLVVNVEKMVVTPYKKLGQKRHTENNERRGNIMEKSEGLYAIIHAPDGKNFYKIKQSKDVGRLWDYFNFDREFRKTHLLNKFAKSKLINIRTGMVITELPKRRSSMKKYDENYEDYDAIADAIASGSSFSGNTAKGIIDEQGNYLVSSYDTLILRVSPTGKVLYFNDKYYSRTTSKLQNIIRRIFGEKLYETNPKRYRRNQDLPEYIKIISPTKVKVKAGMEWKGYKWHTISVKDIVSYYYRTKGGARDIMSGIRYIGKGKNEIAGDWRNIDYLAKEILGIFKEINRPALEKEGRKYGMELR
jgi:hypothetical protein